MLLDVSGVVDSEEGRLMRSRGQVMVLLALLAVGGGWCVAQELAPGVQDALVVVYVRTPDGPRAGQGFFIGDGSLVVTAHHVVSEKSPLSDHRALGLVNVVSPYLGDAREAQVLSVEDELDVALLRVPWVGHPALELAGDQTVIASGTLVVASLKAMNRGLRSRTDYPEAQWTEAEVETLDVDFVAVRAGVARSVQLAGPGDIRPGWSGSPMLVPGPSLVAGCFTSLTLVPSRRGPTWEGGGGPTAGQIKQLVHQAGQEDHLAPSRTRLPRPADADEAFLDLVRALKLLAASRPQQARQAAEGFIRLRPTNVVGYREAARAARAEGELDLADGFFKQALPLDPDGPDGASLRLLYAAYLASGGRLKEARTLLEALPGGPVPSGALAFTLCEVLLRQRDFQRCIQTLQEALQEEPQNARLWGQLGEAHLRMESFDASAQALARAQELLPGNTSFQILLVEALERVGKLDEAERGLQEMVARAPQTAGFRLLLVQFLQRHDKGAEARQHLEKLLEGPPADPGQRVGLAQMLERAGMRDDAERQFRELLETEPNNPEFHFSLAVFLLNNRPEKKQEALQQARVALALPPRRSLSKNLIERFIRDVQRRIEKEKQSETSSGGVANPAPAPVPNQARDR